MSEAHETGHTGNAANEQLLQRWLAWVGSTTTATEELLAQHSERQLMWKPRADVWSMAECFEHMALTGELYYPKIQAAIDTADRRASEPYRPGWFFKRFIGTVGASRKKKVKTFKVFTPHTSQADSGVVRRFLAGQPTLEDLIGQAREVNLNTGKIRSPITNLLRFTIGESLCLNVEHHARHLQQAQELREVPGFPEK